MRYIVKKDGKHYDGWGTFEECTEYQEPEYLKDVPTEYKSLAAIIPAVMLIAVFGKELTRIQKLPEDQRKKAKKELKERLKKMKKK